MTSPPGIVSLVAHALEDGGVDLTAWGLAWARVMPAVILVPALGLRALPSAARAVLALVLGASLFPALRPFAHEAGPWPLLLLVQFVRGLPVAIAAAIPLWAATMAGGVIDAVRGSQESLSLPTMEGPGSPFGVLFSLLAAAFFLRAGGPSHVALLLTQVPADGGSTVASIAAHLSRGISLAVAVAAPLVGASMIVEVTGALIARAASPASVHALLAPLRSLVLVGLTALLFDRIAALLCAAQGL